MNNVIDLDAVRASKKNKKEEADMFSIEANFHEPVYAEVDKVEFGVRTEVLSNALTKHAKKIDALKTNQRLIVNDIKVNENISVVKADLVEASKN